MNPAESYILSREEPFRTIILHLQSLIEQKVPAAELRYKYRIPFYYLKDRPFCYLNQSGDYVDLGFPGGYRLTQHLNKMEGRGRKRVRSLRYRQVHEIDSSVLMEVLEEASRNPGF